MERTTFVIGRDGAITHVFSQGQARGARQQDTDRLIPIPWLQPLTPVERHILREQDLTIIPAYDPLASRQLDRDGGHDPILTRPLRKGLDEFRACCGSQVALRKMLVTRQKQMPASDGCAAKRCPDAPAASDRDRGGALARRCPTESVLHATAPSTDRAQFRRCLCGCVSGISSRLPKRSCASSHKGPLAPRRRARGMRASWRGSPHALDGAEDTPYPRCPVRPQAHERPVLLFVHVVWLRHFGATASRFHPARTLAALPPNRGLVGRNVRSDAAGYVLRGTPGRTVEDEPAGVGFSGSVGAVQL